MSQCSDYKPVVPVVGCDNVLKSLNPAVLQPTHDSSCTGNRGHNVVRVCVYIRLNTYASTYALKQWSMHYSYLCGFNFIYIYLLFMPVQNMCVLKWNVKETCRHAVTLSGALRVYVTLWCYAAFRVVEYCVQMYKHLK